MSNDIGNTGSQFWPIAGTIFALLSTLVSGLILGFLNHIRGEIDKLWKATDEDRKACAAVHQTLAGEVGEIKGKMGKENHP